MFRLLRSRGTCSQTWFMADLLPELLRFPLHCFRLTSCLFAWLPNCLAAGCGFKPVSYLSCFVSFYGVLWFRITISCTKGTLPIFEHCRLICWSTASLLYIRLYWTMGRPYKFRAAHYTCHNGAVKLTLKSTHTENFIRPNVPHWSYCKLTTHLFMLSLFLLPYLPLYIAIFLDHNHKSHVSMKCWSLDRLDNASRQHLGQITYTPIDVPRPRGENNNNKNRGLPVASFQL